MSLKPTFMLMIKKTSDGREAYIHATAKMVNAHLVERIDEKYIKSLLKQEGLDNFLMLEENITELVNALNDAIRQIKSEADTIGLVFDTNSVAIAEDAKAYVTIPSSNLKAKLTIIPAKGGRHFDLDSALKLLKENKVSYGIDERKITDLIKESKTTKSDHVSADVAMALMPVKGKDADFKALVPTVNDRILKPKLRPDGTVDMHELGDLPTVKEGDRLMRKIPPTEGVKGINIYWDFLSPPNGKDKAFHKGDGTEISLDDPNLLIAKIHGQPNLIPNGMRVDPVVHVKAVDLRTGNMNLDANLIVAGDIAEGMKVRCDGDITVGGVIESADVKATGNIIVYKGIVGHPGYEENDEEPSVCVEAGGTLSAKYASYAHLEAKEDILISEQLLHSHTRAHGRVVVGNEHTHGSAITGGYTSASEGIVVDILGTAAGIPTYLDLSGKLALKHAERACNHSIITVKTDMINTMQIALDKFRSIPSSKERQEHIVKIENTINHLKYEVDEAKVRDEQIEVEQDWLSRSIEVRVKIKIFPNIFIKIGGAQTKIKREQAPGKLRLLGSEIEYRPGISKD
ncbi:MAG: DUF342 domain-containing protein [Enterobacterales bacterium]|nr:DUF342 domain-containing protein [Enterobacterales bacterium]